MTAEDNTNKDSESTNVSSQSVTTQQYFQENQKQWLIQSEEYFDKKQYTACLECIKSLQSSLNQTNSSSDNPSSPQQPLTNEIKITMNKKVCELALNSYRNSDEFKQELRQLASQLKINLDKLETLEESQNCILFYNYAVLLYFNKQFGNALKIVEKIYNQFIELIDEKLSKQISFLLADLYIHTRQPLEALMVLHNLEKSLNRRSSNSNSSPKNNNASAKSINETDSIDETDQRTTSNINPVDMIKYQQMISIFKLKSYLLLNSCKLSDKELKHLINIGDSIKSHTASNFKAEFDFINENYSECLKNLGLEMKKTLTNIISAQKLAPNTNVLQQLNAIATTTNILNFNNNNNNVNIINNNNDFILYLLKTTQNLTNWLDSIQSNNDDDDDDDNDMRNLNDPLMQINSSTLIFYNNLALVHHSINKYGLSSLYFQRALNENTKFITKCLSSSSAAAASSSSNHLNNSNSNPNKLEEQEQEVANLPEDNHLKFNLMNRRYELLFNLGISLLFNKQPISAFECLFKVTKVYSQNARLWLRLAECCIMCYRHALTTTNENESESLSDLQNSSLDSTLTASNNEKILKLSEKIKCIQRSFGSGFHHKIQFGTSLTNDLPTANLTINDLIKKEQNDESHLMAKLVTLDFAYMCLRNALKLIPTNQQIFPVNKLSNNDNETLDTEFDDTSNYNETDNTSSNETTKINKNHQQQQQQQINQSGLFNCVWPSKPLNLSELQSLKSSILVSIAYVALCLKDYSNTIRYCNVLLANDDLLNMKCPISKGNKYLAHFYLAEALLYSDKISDSIENLTINAKIESDNDLSFAPSQQLDSSQNHQYMNENINDDKIRFIKKESSEYRHNSSITKWYPKDLNSARAIAFYNLSVSYAIRGEIDMAYRNFNISVNLFEKQPAYTYFMKIYLDLLDGYRQSIQVVLKEHFGHVTIGQTIQNKITSSNNSNQQQKQQQQQQQHQHQQQQAQQQLQQIHLQQQLQQFQQQQQQPPPQQQQQLNLQQQLLQQQLQQLQLQQHSHLLQSQTLNQLLNNPNILLAAAAANNTPTGLPPALSPFNQQQANLTNLLNSATTTTNANNSNPTIAASAAFANLPNLSNANFMSTLAAAVSTNNSSSSSSSTSNNSTSINLNQLLLQQQQQQQQQSYLSQNQMPSRIS